jgi:16S rRNA (guanine(966)-N(2))-methyltransferase RsmD
VRIIAGRARGRALAPPRGSAIRPTADRVKEALFSIVSARLELAGRVALDLYAGSGALALEALSRGAVAAVAVDRDRRCAATAAENARSVGLEGCTVLCAPVSAALRRLHDAGRRFALVLADPPYDDDPAPVVQEVGALDLLEADGMLVVEHRRGRSMPERCGRLVRLLQRNYGDTELSAYVVEGAAERPQEAPR